MLKLFYDKTSCATVARIALEEAGAPYELAWIDIRKGEQRTAKYLEINPKGRVPALLTPRGILTENPAILMYIAQSFPASRLAPLGDIWKLARMTAFNAFLASSVHVTFSKFGRAERYLDTTDAQEEMRTRAPQTLRDHFELIERDLKIGPWVLGPTFSTADIYLAFFSKLAKQFEWFGSLPATLEHFERMEKRTSYRKVYE